MFIQTEATPNPATLKFIPGQPVSPAGSLTFSDLSEASFSPLAQRLLEIEGVRSVFFGVDFITITKTQGEWSYLKPLLLSAIQDHYLSGLPVLTGGHSGTEETASPDIKQEDREIVNTIKEILDSRVRPAVAQDGGDITFYSYNEGIVYLKMKGACSGCPSSIATLKGGVENLLKHFIPEIKEVQAV